MPLKSMEVREWEETNSWSDEIRFLIMCLSSVSSHPASFLFFISRTTEQWQSYCGDLVSLLDLSSLPCPSCDFECSDG